MAKPRVLILRTPGTNCDVETAHAFQLAGAETESAHVDEFLRLGNLLDDFQIFCIPGGFSYGDDLGAGRIAAARLRQHTTEALQEFHQKDRLILGICNGFQILIATGLFFPSAAPEDHLASLAVNASGKYEDRWVQLKVTSDRCVFTQGIRQLYLPVAHAEGRFVVRDTPAMDTLSEQQQLVLRYCDVNGHDDVEYPADPNGSSGHVAAICDATGRIFGLMPHPERFVDRTQHPRWTRTDLPDEGDGLQLFRNAVAYFS